MKALSTTPLAALVLALCTTAMGGPWYKGPVANTWLGGGGYTSLALDGAGRPHISYHDNAGGGLSSALKYVYHDGSAWNIETVDTAGDAGEYTSIAMDPLGHPHISYYDGDNEVARYATRNGSGWQITTLGAAGYGTSIGVDQAGHPHIAYHSGYSPSSSLQYITYNGSTWHTDLIDTNSASYCDLALAVDSGGYPSIAYQYQIWDANGFSHCGLRYAEYDGSEWQVEPVDSGAGYTGEYVSLAFDSLDRPHLAYYDRRDSAQPPPYGMKYAVRHGSTWEIVSIHDECTEYDCYCRHYFSLAVDGQDQPRIACWDSGEPGGLKYIYYDGSEWHVEVVDSSWWGAGPHCSLALDEEDCPHIGYYDMGPNQVKYASLSNQYIPEPASLALLAVGAFALWVRRTKNHHGA